ncbi:MAG: protein-L-isoaspartate O-methyltransferase family protein [Promethearchaeia archaeon]
MKEEKFFNLKKRRLVEHLVSNNILKDKRLINAFKEVPLEEFIPEEFISPVKIYEDRPQLFYFKNKSNYRTISAPHMISIMLQGLVLEEEDDLLILGAKSGYISLLAHKLATKGKIIVLEANSDIAKVTRRNLEKFDLDNQIKVLIKNPLEGMPSMNPKKILVTGAVEQERLKPLLRQLDKDEGVLFAPIGKDLVQIYTQILRDGNNYYGKKQLQVRFTPLMTQIELDKLELITDFDEMEDPIEIEENPEKVDETLRKVKIKYASNIIDNIDVGKEPKVKGNKYKKEEKKTLDKENALDLLEKIGKNIKQMKKEDTIKACFRCAEDIEYHLKTLEEFSDKFNLNIEELRSHLNKIRSFNIVRKELDRKDNIEKKIEIIEKQMDMIGKFEDLLSSLKEKL